MTPEQRQAARRRCDAEELRAVKQAIRKWAAADDAYDAAAIDGVTGRKLEKLARRAEKASQELRAMIGAGK